MSNCWTCATIGTKDVISSSCSRNKHYCPLSLKTFILDVDVCFDKFSVIFNFKKHAIQPKSEIIIIKGKNIIVLDKGVCINWANRNTKYLGEFPNMYIFFCSDGGTSKNTWFLSLFHAACHVLRLKTILIIS